MMTFDGYARADGSVGVRNYVLILSVTGLTGPTARRIGRIVGGTKVTATPYGSGLMGDDADVQTRSLIAFGRHPNVAATLVIGGSAPHATHIADEIAKSGKPVERLILDECDHDAVTVTERGIRIAARLVREASLQRRAPAGLDRLFLALECGRSDPSSGLVANPLVGRVVDRVIEAGGRAVLGETIEWLGAEHLLIERAANANVANAIRSAVERREKLAVDAGMDLIGNNPGPTNVAAGLSTIEEKSLGGIAKGGSTTIRGLIGIAETPSEPGLYLMDAPAYAPESVTGLIAAGAQLTLFTTGVGNSFVSGLTPTIKISANPVATARLREQLDFDASDVFASRASLDDAAARLAMHMTAVASGALTWGEILDEGEDVVSRLGPAL